MPDPNTTAPLYQTVGGWIVGGAATAGLIWKTAYDAREKRKDKSAATAEANEKALIDGGVAQSSSAFALTKDIIQSLRDDAKRRDEQVEALRTEFHAISVENARLEGAQSRFEALQQSYNVQHEQIQRLEGKVAALERVDTENAELRRTNAKLESRLDEAERTIRGLREENDQLRAVGNTALNGLENMIVKDSTERRVREELQNGL